MEANLQPVPSKPKRAQLVEIVGTKGSGKYGLLLHLATDLHQLYNYEPWRIESPQIKGMEKCPSKRREAILSHWRRQHHEITEALTNPKIDVVLCKNYVSTSAHLGHLIGLDQAEITANHTDFPTPDIIVLLDHPHCEEDPEHPHLLRLCKQHGWFHGRTEGRKDTARLIDSIIEEVIRHRQVA